MSRWSRVASGLLVCAGVACGGPATGSSAGQGSAGAREVVEPAARPAEEPRAQEEVETPRVESSLDKIAAAHAVGTIDRQEALRLAVHAVFDPRRLDPAFVGARPAREQVELMRDVMAAWPTFDEATRAELTPYFTPPLEPGSHWAPRMAAKPAAGGGAGSEAGASGGGAAGGDAAGGGGAGGGAAGGGAAGGGAAGGGGESADVPAVGAGHGYIDSATAPVRVWYVGDGRAEAEALVASFDANEVWKKAHEILWRRPCEDGARGGSPRVDVYLVAQDASDFDPALTQGLGSHAGIAVPLEGHWHAMCPDGSPVFILVERGNVHAASVLAHELFHAFQHAYPASGVALTGPERGENGWFTESTAESFAESIYHASWGRLADEKSPVWNTQVNRWQPVVGPLDACGSVRDGRIDQYATFVFWTHLVTQRGLDPRTIERILIGLPKQPAIEQVGALPGFRKDFAAFAADLYNLKPFDRLRQGGEPVPRALLAQKVPSVVESTAAAATAELRILLVPGYSARYARIVVKDKQVAPGTRSLVVRLDRLDPALEVRAALETNKKSRDERIDEPPSYDATVEDWTLGDPRTLCFDRPEEDVDEIVLVLANTGARQVDGPTIRVERRAEPCPARRGSLYYRASARQSIPPRGVEGTTLVESTLALTSAWEVTFDAYDPDTREVRFSFTARNQWAGLGARTMTMAYDSEVRTVHGAYACRSLVEGESRNPAPAGSAAAREAERGGVSSVEGGQIVVRLPADDTEPRAEYQVLFTPALIEREEHWTREEHETNRAITACGGATYRADTSITYSSTTGIRREEVQTCEGLAKREHTDEAPPMATLPALDEVLRGTYDWRSGVIRGAVQRAGCVFATSTCEATSPDDGPCEGSEALGIEVRLPPFVTTGGG